MKRAAVLLVAVALVAGCASNPFFVKPDKPPHVDTVSDSWAVAKASFGATLVLFTRYAQAACPIYDANTDSYRCPQSVTEGERAAIREGQRVRVKALDNIRKGDAALGGDMTAFIDDLNELIAKLNEQIARID